ncbi:MAG TPA: type II secretion system protein N, partial [Castellaniella sp.]|nr:type II secretion system protein N [Castellaniella sp.]
TVHAMFNALDLGGEVLLEWPEMVLGPQGLAVGGTEPIWLRWGNVSSALSRVRPLGDYTLSVRPADRNGWALDLRTIQGPLLLKGQGMVAAGKPPLFDGRAWADPHASRDTRDALQALLQALGPSSGSDQGATLRVR